MEPGQPEDDGGSEHEAPLGLADDVEEVDKPERVSAFAARGYVPANIDEAPDLQPTLEQYEDRWEAKLAKHTQTVPDEFYLCNLVPNPIWQLWQDCPIRAL